MNQFPLHQQVLEEIADRELSELISKCVEECKRRALLSKVYHSNARSIVNHVAKNVATVEAREAAKTPVLDRLKAEHGAKP